MSLFNKITTDQTTVKTLTASTHAEVNFKQPQHGSTGAEVPLQLTLVNTDATALVWYRIDGAVASGPTGNDRVLLPRERVLLERSCDTVSLWSTGTPIVEVTFSA